MKIRHLVCAVFGHKYRRSTAYAPKFYNCLRCQSPGFEVPRRES